MSNRGAALLACLFLAGLGVRSAEARGAVQDYDALKAIASKKPFWIVSGSAAAPLGGWAVVALESSSPPGVRQKRFLVQGVLWETKFESYDVTNVQGLSVYPPGAIVHRDRHARLTRRGSLEDALKQLEAHGDTFRRLAAETLGGGALETTPAEVMRTAIDSESGTLLVRYAFQPTRQADPHGLYHHIEVVAFYELESTKIPRLHVFPVPLE